MAWEASLEIDSADPGWPDSDARHSYAGLAHLRDVVFSALLAKVAPRRLFKFLDQSIDLGHRCLPSDHKYLRREPFGINCEGDGRVCPQRRRARRRTKHMRTGNERRHNDLASVPMKPRRNDPRSAIFGD